MRKQIQLRHLVFLLLSSTTLVKGTLGVSQSNGNAIAIQSDGSILAGGSITYNGMQQFMLARYTTFGTIDTTYGYNGYSATPIGSAASINGLVVQSNDQAVVVGLADPSIGSTTFAIARYTSSGTLDTSFKSTGFVTKLIGTGSVASSIQLDSSGKYLIGGTSIIGGQAIMTVARYNANGTQDTTFASYGIATKRIFSSAGASDIAIQSSGKIVAAGFASNSHTREIGLVRFNTDGSLDTTFGTSGTVATAIGADACAHAVAIQPNNYIIAAGVSNGKFTLVRYTANGTIDTNFASSGIAATTIGGNSQINDVALQSNGKIVAVGFSDNKFALARYNVTGTLDATFGIGGIVTTAIGLTAIANSVVLQNNGQIVVAGTSDTGTVICRYNADGSTDTAFGTNGIINFPNNFNAPDIFGIADVNIADDATISYGKLNLNNSIMDSDINSNAAISNTKLAPLVTPGTVLNTATTATSFEVSGAIVARDTLGNFNANTIHATLNGNVIGSASNNLLKAGDTMSGPLILAAGDTIQPSLQFADSPFSGFSADSNTITLSTNGAGRLSVDTNGAVTINAPLSGIGLTVQGGGEEIVGTLATSENIIFNTASTLLNAVGTTQGALVKIFTGTSYIGSSNSITINYAGAGFSGLPVICANPLSGVSAYISINTITSTNAVVTSNVSNVPFNYIAIGI